MLSETVVRKCLREACDRDGLREWSRRHGCDPGYVSKVISGDKGIGASVCRALGLEPVVMYRQK